MDKKLTLAVAAYNVGEYLKECVDSALSQPGDFSVIIADDGSPDMSARVADLSAAADSRVIALHFKNSGVSVARNHALELCDAGYIWYIDGDDKIADGSIAKLNALMAGGEQAIIFSRAIFGAGEANIGEDFKLSQADIRDLRYKNMSEYPAPKLKRVAAMSMCVILFDVDYLNANNVRFLPGLRKSQDVLFNAEAFKPLASARFHDEAFYIYRPNVGSVSMRYIPYAPESYIALMERLEKLIAGEADEFMKRLLCARAAWCVREALRSCFCHVDNIQPYSERKRAYNDFMKNAAVRRLFKGARLRDLSIIDKFSTLLARGRMFFMLNLGSKIVGRTLAARMRSNKAIYKNA